MFLYRRVYKDVKDFKFLFIPYGESGTSHLLPNTAILQKVLFVSFHKAIEQIIGLVDKYYRNVGYCFRRAVQNLPAKIVFSKI